MDADSDGYLNYEEIANAIKSEWDGRVPRVLLQEIITGADQDGTGTLDECETLGLIYAIVFDPAL